MRPTHLATRQKGIVLNHILPRDLLADPAMQRALAARDFATVFTQARRRGMGYTAISKACDIKPDRVSAVAAGRNTITGIATIERIADGLRIPGAMVGLAARHWELSQPAGREDDPVHRRGFLQSAALTVGAALPLAATVLTETEQALAYDGADDVTGVEAAAERLGRGYRDRTPDEMLTALTTEVAAAAPLLKLHHPKRVRDDLARAVAQLTGMAAIVLHDMGRTDDATDWFATATTAAKRSGDRHLHAWVLARKAMVPLNYGAPQLAARIAEQARRAAGTGDSAAAALAASVAARAHALAGHTPGAVDALNAADRIAGKLSGAAAVDTWLGYCPQKHHVHRSQALTTLGDTTAARDSQQAGIALTTTTGMTRTLLLLDEATCLHRDGDPAGACRAAIDVVTHAPQRFRSGLVRQRALDLYDNIPDGVRTSSAGRDLAEVLAAA